MDELEKLKTILAGYRRDSNEAFVTTNLVHICHSRNATIEGALREARDILIQKKLPVWHLDEIEQRHWSWSDEQVAGRLEQVRRNSPY